MKARFVISIKKDKLAKGILYILTDSEQILFEHLAWSGAERATEKNKGYLPEGEYEITRIFLVGQTITNWQAYTRDKYGWFAGIEPKFKTDRFALGIHPDGSIPGSAGCIVSDFNLDNSVKLHNLIEQGLERGKIPLTVMTTLDQRRA